MGLGIKNFSRVKGSLGLKDLGLKGSEGYRI